MAYIKQIGKKWYIFINYVQIGTGYSTMEIARSQLIRELSRPNYRNIQVA